MTIRKCPVCSKEFDSTLVNYFCYGVMPDCIHNVYISMGGNFHFTYRRFCGVDDDDDDYPFVELNMAIGKYVLVFSSYENATHIYNELTKKDIGCYYPSEYENIFADFVSLNTENKIEERIQNSNILE